MVFTSTVIMKQSECPSMGGDELNPGLVQPCPVENHHIGLHLYSWNPRQGPTARLVVRGQRKGDWKASTRESGKRRVDGLWEQLQVGRSLDHI